MEKLNTLISLLEQNLIFSDTKLISVEDDPSYSSITPHSYFNPPDVALNNALQTPQLQPSEEITSQDYHENNSRASTGYAPTDFDFPNKYIFQISGE